MSRPFTVDDLLNVNLFTKHCPWDLSPDGRLLAVTLSQGKRRVLDDNNYGAENGAYIVLIDVATGESIEPFSDLQMSWAGRWSPFYFRPGRSAGAGYMRNPMMCPDR